ncbi:hypothetical protein Oweho_3199 [Owenweeksia hongkongensis DSM 17368]|uniref:Uncharacterized protein n=2 Tax=Owenweeksia TaxID=267986 RepID=G8R3R3_OWEHD|nr:hypothetical protein Oweho_3199 [Owenweeksia hongkongensis DSM 17368]
MDRMQKRLTKYMQKREQRRHLMEREILIYLRRKKEKSPLNPHQCLELAKHQFADELKTERMQVVRDRSNKSIKVILKKSA